MKDSTKGSGSKWQKKSCVIIKLMHMFLQRPYGHSWSGVEGKIAGLGSCGKIFLIIPLTEIYNTFLNPSSSKHAFVGSDNNELIFLNDLKWNQEMIP